MKRITILAATLFALSGLQAQTSIDGVLRNIETNNKELQANAQLIASQKLETRTDNNLPDPTLSYAHLWNNKDKNNTIGELVVSQSFDFPSLYATRNQLNRLKAGAFDRAEECIPSGHPATGKRCVPGYHHAAKATADTDRTAAKRRRALSHVRQAFANRRRQCNRNQ